MAELVPEAQEEPFDPALISPVLKQATLAEVQQFVENLNAIIRAKNFDGWLAYLSEECRKIRNSPEFLTEQSTSPRLKGQPKLTGIEDYFIRVVVPSRADYHVDDIEFINANRVKAYTVNSRTKQRLVLYTLDYLDGSWKIGV